MLIALVPFEKPRKFLSAHRAAEQGEFLVLQKDLSFANILDNKSLIVFQIDNIASNTGTLLGSRTYSLFTLPFSVLLLSRSNEFIKGYPG